MKQIDTEDRKLIDDFLSAGTLMQLATIGSDGAPWVCTVYFVADEDMNIYWTSAKFRRHSQEIMHDGRVAVTILPDTHRKRSLQIIGIAEKVLPDDSEKADTVYGQKFGHKPERLEEVRQNTPDGRAYWKLSPKEIYCFDEETYPDSPKKLLFQA